MLCCAVQCRLGSGQRKGQGQMEGAERCSPAAVHATCTLPYRRDDIRLAGDVMAEFITTGLEIASVGRAPARLEASAVLCVLFRARNA